MQKELKIPATSPNLNYLNSLSCGSELKNRIHTTQKKAFQAISSLHLFSLHPLGEIVVLCDFHLPPPIASAVHLFIGVSRLEL
jgi:hypothetical protein